MGIVSGNSTFVVFDVLGDLPENTMDYIADRIVSFSFRDIDDNYDENSIGWVSVLNMFDSDFKYASYINGDFVTLTLRMDERKVSPAVIKKFVQKEEERIKIEKEIPKISRGMRTEIKTRVTDELTKKAFPVPSVFDVYWSLSESYVVLFTTNNKMIDLLEDYFKECFGLLLRRKIPYTIAETILDEEQILKLSQLNGSVLN